MATPCVDVKNYLRDSYVDQWTRHIVLALPIDTVQVHIEIDEEGIVKGNVFLEQPDDVRKKKESTDEVRSVSEDTPA